MQYNSLDYTRQYGMEWLTKELQVLFNLACITTHIPTRNIWFGKIAELSVKK